MNVENFYSAWKGNQSCGECSLRLNVFRKKKICFFCKNSFCQGCIIRREDKKLCCSKCQILTSRPLDRSKLLNLRSKDILNYLTSRHIPTNGCVEKEDLVNVLIKAVNNSCFHPSTSTFSDCASSANGCAGSLKNSSYCGGSEASLKLSQSVDNLAEDGIRITGHNLFDNEINKEQTSSNEFENSFDSSETFVNNISSANQESNENVEMTNNTPNTELNEDKSVCAQDSSVLSISKPMKLSDIKSKSDLDALSVKQLKKLLLSNRTDYKGCIERAELIQKANRLWNDYTDSRKDLENLTADELCKICMDAPIECVLLECGHMATCTFCGKQLCECPICRQFVVRCVRTFKA